MGLFLFGRETMARKLNEKIQRTLPYKLYYFICEDAQSMQNYINGFKKKYNNRKIVIKSEKAKKGNDAISVQEYKIEKSIVRPYYETPKAFSLDTLSTYRYLEANSAVIYPYYKDNEGNIRLIELSELRNKYPYAYKYFIENKDNFIYSEKGKLRDIKPYSENTNEWYRYGRHQSLEIGEIDSKIIVGILSKGNKYAIDNNKTLVSSGGTAGYCMISIPQESPYSIYYIQAILNSKMLEWYMCRG